MVKAGERAYIVKGSVNRRTRVSILLACRTRPHAEQWAGGSAPSRRGVPGAGGRRSSASRARSSSELRRRLGGAFTLDELVDLYDEGTGWCTDLAVEVAPDEPFAWDARVVADAAFGRYERAATDFAGGRRI